MKYYPLLIAQNEEFLFLPVPLFKKPGEGARYKHLLRRSSTKNTALLNVGTVNNGKIKQPILFSFKSISKHNLCLIHHYPNGTLTYQSKRDGGRGGGGRSMFHTSHLSGTVVHIQEAVSVQKCPTETRIFHYLRFCKKLWLHGKVSEPGDLKATHQGAQPVRSCNPLSADGIKPIIPVQARWI